MRSMRIRPAETTVGLPIISRHPARPRVRPPCSVSTELPELCRHGFGAERTTRCARSSVPAPPHAELYNCCTGLFGGLIARRQPPFRTDCPRDWTPPSGHPLFAPSGGEDYQIGWCEIPQRIKELAWKCARWHLILH